MPHNSRVFLHPWWLFNFGWHWKRYEGSKPGRSCWSLQICISKQKYVKSIIFNITFNNWIPSILQNLSLQPSTITDVHFNTLNYPKAFWKKWQYQCCPFLALQTNTWALKQLEELNATSKIWLKITLMESVTGFKWRMQTVSTNPSRITCQKAKHKWLCSVCVIPIPVQWLPKFPLF